jgi:flotillin
MVAGEKARVVAQQALEQERIGLEQRRLEADVVAPARANLEAKRLDAEAAAATIVEDGKAQVEVFQRLVAQYQAAGSDAQQIFVLNMLPDIIDRLVSTVNGVAIDKISIIDGGGQGTGVPGMLGQLPAAVISLAEQIETATGVDILGTLRNDGDRSGGGASGVPAVAAAPAPETATSSPEPAPEPVSKPEPSPKPEATWEPEPEPEPEPAPEPQRWRTTSSPTPPARPGPLPPPPASRPYPGSPPPPSPPGPRG